MPEPGPHPHAPGESTEALRAWYEARLEAVRARTWTLVDALTEDQLTTQPEPVMGTLAWDVGHIGFFENLWLVDELGGDPVDEATAKLYDPFEHPRSQRGELDLPDRHELRAFLSDVRKRALHTLAELDLEGDGALTRHGFVHDMIVRHECQHQENMLITLQLMGSDPQGLAPYQPPNREAKPAAQTRVDGMVELPAGSYEIGTAPRVGAYDNEWPSHTVELERFRIARAPVTNCEFLAFIEDGGYEAEGYWSQDGWLICQALGWEHPKYWQATDDGWVTREFDREIALPPDQPVVHTSYYEAEAYASWAGKRLPTEKEWEIAASWDPATGTRRLYPWGDDPWSPERANLGQRLYGPAPVGAYPEGISAVGCHQMVGDVWEWTSSLHTGYPGFEPFPYPEYALTHMDMGYQVLRGGSWATWPDVAHATVRNWHQPDHQHILAGIRLAEDA